MGETYDVLIVGAGLSGLGTAGYLAKAGKKVKIVEKLPKVGGSTIVPEVNGYRISQLAPICPQPSYDNPSGWYKLARDFDADVHVGPSAATRLSIRKDGTNKDFIFPCCASPAAAARWLVNVVLQEARPELITGQTLQDVTAVITEMYDQDLLTLGTEWGDLSPKEYLAGRTEDPGAVYLITMLSASCTFTGDYDYSYEHASLGKAFVLLKIWLGAGGLMVVPEGCPQEGISQPIADAVERLGVEIETGVDVKNVIIKDGKVEGLKVTRGEEEDILTADHYVVATRWGAWPGLFDPKPDFIEQKLGEIMQPEHIMASAFKTYFLDDKIDLHPAFFAEIDAESGSHVLGGYAQSVEQPWNTVPGTHFIWAYRIMSNATYQKLGQDAIEKEMHEDMARLYPGFDDHLIGETPFGGRVAPSHFFYNNQKKLEHHYDSVKNLYFAGDCTTPIAGTLTDGAASTGEIVAKLILEK
jgi:phytoene dehydrogenase-like protein